MQQQIPVIFTCQACGHQFQSAWQLVAQQPTCPRCRTYGRITGPNGAPVVLPPAPAAAPVPRPMGGPVRRVPRPRRAQAGEVVQVHASVAYGHKQGNKALVTTLIALGLGLGCIVVLYFIVTTLAKGSQQQEQQRREVVQDPRDFERAIDESVGKVRKLLENIPRAEVRESTDISEVLELIRLSGSSAPAWDQPPRPGQPFKSAAFVVSGRHENTGEPDAGFVMLLYYKTLPEFTKAAEEISSQINMNTRNFSLTVNKDLWYVAYSGSPYGGRMFDALKNARDLGKPSSFRQFTDRVGSTYKGRDTEG